MDYSGDVDCTFFVRDWDLYQIISPLMSNKVIKGKIRQNTVILLQVLILKLLIDIYVYIYDKYNKIDVYTYNIKLSSQLFLAINQMP